MMIKLKTPVLLPNKVMNGLILWITLRLDDIRYVEEQVSGRDT